MVKKSGTRIGFTVLDNIFISSGFGCIVSFLRVQDVPPRRRRRIWNVSAKYNYCPPKRKQDNIQV